MNLTFLASKLCSFIFKPKISNLNIKKSFEVDGKFQLVRFSYPFRNSILISSNVEDALDFSVISTILLKKIKYTAEEKHISISKDTETYFIYLSSEDLSAVLPFSFIVDVFSFLLIDKNKYSNKENINLENFTRDLYISTSGIPWDLEDFFSSLDNKTIQFVFNALLKSGAISYDMIAALVISLGKIGMKIKSNLSSNVISEVESSMKKSGIDNYRWIREVDFITRVNMKQVFFESGSQFDEISTLKEVKNLVRNIVYFDLASRANIEKLAYEIKSKYNIYNILKYISRNSLAKALSKLDKNILILFKDVFSTKGYLELSEDVNYFISSPGDFLEERIELIQAFKSLIFEQQYEKGFVSVAKLLDYLDDKNIFFIINESSLKDFLIVSKSLSEKYRMLLMERLSGVVRDIVKDFIKGHIKFPYTYGETAISTAFYNVSKAMFFCFDIWK